MAKSRFLSKLFEPTRPAVTVATITAAEPLAEHLASPANGLAIYHRLLRQVLPYWKAFGVAVLAMAVYAATETGFAALMKPLLDDSFIAKDPSTVRLVALFLIALFLLRGIAGFLSSYGLAWVGRRVVEDLRGQLFRHYLGLPAAFYDTTSSGHLLSKIIYDVEQVAQAATNAVTVVVKDSLTVLGLLGWMIYLSAPLALIFILVGPLIAWIVIQVNRRFRGISVGIQSAMGNVTHATEEAIAGQRVIKIFGGQEQEASNFEQLNANNRRLSIKMSATSASSVALTQFIAAGALSGIILLASFGSIISSITVGGFVSFIAAMIMMLGPLKRVTTINATIQRGIAAAQSIFAMLDSPVEADSGVQPLLQASGEIEYAGVSFSYAQLQGAVLHDISFIVKPGQKIALVGRSGSGKSTLVSLLARFYNIVSGQILLDGHDIRDLRLADLRQQIALVSQDVILFNDTIRNNIAFGALRVVSEDAIVQAAEAAYAMEFIQQLPQGLDTLLGENGVLLSGGQRQRLAIARALLKNAPVLILDEATSALDTASERYIQAALERLMERRTTLIIAHRLSTIEQADLILVLHDGRIVETGKHAQLLAAGGQYAALHKMQFLGD